MKDWIEIIFSLRKYIFILHNEKKAALSNTGERSREEKTKRTAREYDVTQNHVLISRVTTSTNNYFEFQQFSL